MDDSMPSTSGRAEVYEKERQPLQGGMWVYIQPMAMYRHIQERQQSKALFLRRNLTYHSPKIQRNADRYTDMSVQLTSTSGHPLFAALCKKDLRSRQSLMAFEPLSVQLSNPPKTSPDSLTDTHTLHFQVPHAHQHHQSKLGILAMAVMDPCTSHLIDAFKLKKRPGCCKAQAPRGNTTFRLTKDCTTRMAFGVIPSGSDVCWLFAPLPLSWPSNCQVHAKVQDKRGTLRMALGNTGCLLRLSNQDPGGLLDVHFRLDAHPNCNASRPASGSASASCSAGQKQAAGDAMCSQADKSNSHSAASTTTPHNQGGPSESGRVQFQYHFHEGQHQYHCRETTTNFACFACSQNCNGLVGLQQHIEASHDLFDFGYPKGESGEVPTVAVRCPVDLYDQQDRLQTPEADDMCRNQAKNMSFYCPRRLRRQRLQQYSMTEHQRRDLNVQLTHNKFSKAAWRPHRRSTTAGPHPNKVAQSSLSGPWSPALPLRPFLAQPHHAGTHARAGSHAVASTSSSHCDHLARPSRPAASANASGSGSGSAKLGRASHPQAPPRKRPRVQRDPPTVPHTTGAAPIYFHARSCTRMTPQEVAHILQDPHAVPDSDDEEDQAQWKERAVRQLDNQTDLSAAEKDLMLRWNVYLHDQPCLSDAQMSQRCRDFAAATAKDMQKDPNLRRCFLVHLINLWEFNLVPAAVVDECVACVDSA